jgi:hypothetical protein
MTCFQVSSQNLLSPTGNSNQQRRPSSVMFSDVVLFHGGGADGNGETRNVCSSEKMTQTGDDNLWPVLGSTGTGQQIGTQQQVGMPNVQPASKGGLREGYQQMNHTHTHTPDTTFLFCRLASPKMRAMKLPTKGCQNI